MLLMNDGRLLASGTPAQVLTPGRDLFARHPVAISLLLSACSSVGVGVRVPLFHGVSIGVGGGSGGVHLGVGVGVGPVGVNQRGQVSTGVGVGSSTTIYDPEQRRVRR